RGAARGSRRARATDSTERSGLQRRGAAEDPHRGAGGRSGRPLSLRECGPEPPDPGWRIHAARATGSDPRRGDLRIATCERARSSFREEARDLVLGSWGKLAKLGRFFVARPFLGSRTARVKSAPRNTLERTRRLSFEDHAKSTSRRIGYRWRR